MRGFLARCGKESHLRNHEAPLSRLACALAGHASCCLESTVLARERGGTRPGEQMQLDGFRKTLHQIDKIRYRPALLQKIVHGYVHTLVRRRPTLRIVEFSMNHSCQSSCDYWYASKFRRPGEALLDVDEKRDIWRQSSKMGAFCSLILGGEPTLHPNVTNDSRTSSLA